MVGDQTGESPDDNSRIEPAPLRGSGLIRQDRIRTVRLFSTCSRLPLFKSLVRATLLSAVLAATALLPRAASAEALLLIEADTGKVLQAENATYPWYPASVTKLMTAYVTLKAVKEGRISLDSLLTVSPVAAAEKPSKMGFPVGTQVTVDNALKMMMVKSANDIAVVLAEGIGGSVEGFAADMNRTAQRLGMTQTHYVNPNGLPDERQVTSARDLGILARAIIRDLPEYDYYNRIQSIKYGRRITQNFNRLMGRYPGADGMKTGFICASGFNLVASATRDGKRLIAVVLGTSSGQTRAVRAAQLLDRGFSANTLTWLRPALGTVESLAPIDAAPPNLRDEICGPKRKRPASDADDDSVSAEGESPTLAYFSAGLQTPVLRPVDMIAAAAAPTEPVIVYTGPKKSGADLIAVNAVDSAKQTPKAKVKKARVAKKPAADTAEAKPAAGDKTAATAKKPAAKTAASKPAPAKPADKPAATKPAAAKPATSAAQAKPAAQKPAPAKPAATAAKPDAKPKPAVKPAPKSASDSAKPKAAAPPS